MTTTTDVVAERKTRSVPVFFKAHAPTDTTPDGTFDAIIAVFNNVDHGGDRILAEAFDETLAEWKASGDPVPVIFSHQWENLYAHVGEVDPKNLTALRPGDDRLPPELKDLGGLLAEKAQMDLGAEGEAGAFTRTLWGKLKRRLIKEFSFAYEVPPGGARPSKDATDLLKLGLIEIGPTLKGMNPATALLDAKAAQALIAGKTAYEALELLDDLVPVPPPAKAQRPARVKKISAGRPDGAVEDTLGTIAACARLWASFKYPGELYYAHIEGTFLDAKAVLITAERWSDPYGEGPLWELSYELDADGAIITDAKAVEATVTLTRIDTNGAKRRAKGFLEAGYDRKTAIWLTVLDDESFEDLYGDADGPEPDDTTQGSTTLGSSSGNLSPSTRGQGRGPRRGKAEEQSGATASPTGVLLEIEELSSTNP